MGARGRFKPKKGKSWQPPFKFGFIGLTEQSSMGEGDPHPPFRSPHGFSEVTRETPETAACRGTTPAALRRETEEEELKREGVRVETGVKIRSGTSFHRGLTVYKIQQHS